MGTQSFHFVPHCSENWNTEGLHSDVNASNRSVPKDGKTKKVIRKVKRYAIVPVLSRLNRQMEIDTKSETVRNRSGPFPSEQANGN